MKRRSTIARDLRTPKYRPRVVADKKKRARDKRVRGVQLMQNHAPSFLACAPIYINRGDE